MTDLLAVNSNGLEKLLNYVISKLSKKIPTKYGANIKSWMTAVLFANWLKNLDRKMISLKWKAVLFIDQCPAHPTDYAFQNLKVFFFPCKFFKKWLLCNNHRTLLLNALSVFAFQKQVYSHKSAGKSTWYQWKWWYNNWLGENYVWLSIFWVCILWCRTIYMQNCTLQ